MPAASIPLQITISASATASTAAASDGVSEARSAAATHCLHRRSPAFLRLSCESAKLDRGKERSHTQHACMPAAPPAPPAAPPPCSKLELVSAAEAAASLVPCGNDGRCAGLLGDGPLGVCESGEEGCERGERGDDRRGRGEEGLLASIGLLGWLAGKLALSEESALSSASDADVRSL